MRICPDARAALEHQAMFEKEAAMPVSSQRKRAQFRRAGRIAAKRRNGSNLSPAGKRVEVPEWMTDAWRHRVEAEARRRLTDNIRGIGAER
jgi:hypothetical protein